MPSLSYNLSNIVDIPLQRGIYACWFKRHIDIAASLIGLIVLSPFLLFMSLLLLFCNRGTPFFIQERVGRDMRPFKIIKFKTMNDKKDVSGNLLPDAERTGPLGRFLRATSIDELPELVNVFIGDMSLIGPRPWIPEQMARFEPLVQEKRMALRPGITGRAQVQGRNNLTFRQRVCLDLEYQRNLTFYQDLKILFGTFAKVLKREGIDQCQEAFDHTSGTIPPKDPETRGLRGNQARRRNE